MSDALATGNVLHLFENVATCGTYAKLSCDFPIFATLEQPLGPQADMPLRADDDMVVHADAQPLARLYDLARHVDVLTARFGRSAGVVVDHASSSA